MLGIPTCFRECIIAIARLPYRVPSIIYLAPQRFVLTFCYFLLPSIFKSSTFY